MIFLIYLLNKCLVVPQCLNKNSIFQNHLRESVPQCNIMHTFWLMLILAYIVINLNNILTLDVIFCFKLNRIWLKLFFYTSQMIFQVSFDFWMLKWTFWDEMKKVKPVHILQMLTYNNNVLKKSTSFGLKNFRFSDNVKVGKMSRIFYSGNSIT